MTQLPNHPTRLQVSPDDAGSRLDAFLVRHLGVSRAQARRLLAQGLVLLDCRRAFERDKGVLLAAGSAIEIAPFTEPAAMQVIPQPEAPLTILAQGQGWLIVDKPAGWPVHPLREHETGTVLNALVARHPEIQGVGEGGLRSGVVHRLDIETSGTLLLATTQEMWTRLRQAFEEHRTQKIYRAIVRGKLSGRGREVMNLLVAQHRPAKVRVVEPHRGTLPAGARRCDLEWKALESFERATLLEVTLGTGFLHQIRVMLAHLVHPVLGDGLYGSAAEPDVPAVRRPMLHAAYLQVKDVAAQSPDPEDLTACLAALRQNRG